MSFIREKIEEFDNTYGIVAKWVWRVVFYPLLILSFYAGTGYLDKNYVSRVLFDKTVANSTGERAKVAEEQKAGLKDISGKLDALLLRDSANAQRFSDYDRRLGRLEDKVDKLKGN